MSQVACIASAGVEAVDIGSLDGEVVTEMELRFWMDQCRSEVHRYFYRKYEVSGDPDFWNPATRYGTESPLEKLKSLGMERLIRTRVQLQLAMKEGIIPDSSFSGIMQLRHPENARRLSALKSDKVIYGPKQYNEHVYFDHYLSNLVIRLKRHLDSSDPDSFPYDNLIQTFVEQADVQLFPAYHSLTLD